MKAVIAINPRERRTQAGLLLHTSNVFRIDWQERLGERLCALAGMEKAFFCNSGAEANETALKLARLHGHSKGIELPGKQLPQPERRSRRHEP
ncbi:MAG: aminotransferase class III-fold pyridoxal phosphate-dependent enzyme [Porticoccaceae bacterium]